MTTRTPSKQETENPVLTFDFSAETPAVTNPSFSVFVQWSAVGDPNPQAILSGAPQVDGAKVYQRVQGGINMTDYAIRCTATAQDGVTQLVVPAILPVRNLPG